MQQPQSELRSVSPRYLTVLMIVVTLGVLVSAFDSVARNDALPLILKYLHMNVAAGGMVLSAGFIATTLGNLFVGPIMDRWGRKRVFVYSMIAIALTSGFTAFIQNVVEYILVGFFSGIVLTVIEIGNVLVAEEAPKESRGLLSGIVTAGFPMGTIVIGLVGAVVLPSGNWRLLFLLSFTSIILAVVAHFALREPPRSAEALRVKRESARIRHGEHVATTFGIDEDKAVRREWAQIFAPDLRRQTIVASLFGILVNFSVGFVLVVGVEYFVIFDHLGIAAASLALTVEGIFTLVGEIVAGWLADRWASRNLLIVWNIIGAVVVALFAVRGGPAWIYALMAAFGFFGQGYQGTWWRYLNDSFPTRARGTGSAFVTAVYFFGFIFAPTMYGQILNSGHLTVAPLLSAGIVLVGALILFAGRKIPPRRELEELAT
ncbi:MAG: MFS transporter [Firmicutes bacterium]|nr:MFS transporter [Alicyclobacillaceae bacterium]MCL6498224.1 MFS transporter [Bacillota bacterium]